jgi:hypothetical protein
MHDGIARIANQLLHPVGESLGREKIADEESLPSSKTISKSHYNHYADLQLAPAGISGFHAFLFCYTAKGSYFQD